MARTRTGSFPIGFRRGWSDWQKDARQVIAFATQNGFEAIDFGSKQVADIKQAIDAGLRIGSVDLMQWPDLASPDAAKRRAAVEANMSMVKTLVSLGARNFFAVVIPEDKARNRKENFDFAVDGYGQLCAQLSSVDAKLVLEGWPGGGENLACTPADYRAFLQAVGSDAAGVNFDPSHLIRMGIDPVRFVDQFAPRIFHVHGKDTEILDDELYEHGNFQRATFAKGHGFGAHHWRYTIPGHGCARWTRLLKALEAAGYAGCVSIELEDENFNGTEQGEKRGLIAGRDFLAGV